MSTRNRQKRRINQDAHPTVRLRFPDGTPEALGRAFIQRIPWRLGYQEAIGADGRRFVQAVYRAPKPFAALQFINDTDVTREQVQLAIEYFMAAGTT